MSMISLTTPLSESEMTELDEFLMSGVTPEGCMDISALDGFLTSLVIGPGLVPPSVWIKAIWGGESEPAFESSAQAQRVISLIMRRSNAISSMFNEPPESHRSFTSARSRAAGIGARTIGAGGSSRQFA